MSDYLPYRPCVGVALINRAGEAFIGHRKRKRASEVLDKRSWQMPQGGIDEGEAPIDAARRELWEETGVRSIELVAEMPGWLNYDLPDGMRGRWSGRFRGQSQKWFLLRLSATRRRLTSGGPAGAPMKPNSTGGAGSDSSGCPIWSSPSNERSTKRCRRPSRRSRDPRADIPTPRSAPLENSRPAPAARAKGLASSSR